MSHLLSFNNTIDTNLELTNSHMLNIYLIILAKTTNTVKKLHDLSSVKQLLTYHMEAISNSPEHPINCSRHRFYHDSFYQHLKLLSVLDAKINLSVIQKVLYYILITYEIQIIFLFWICICWIIMNWMAFTLVIVSLLKQKFNV